MIDFADIQNAAARLANVVHRTPVVRSRSLDALTGVSLHLKAENLQRAGSFKIRGAYHKIAGLSAAARQRGVISYSSGNHAQGVALAASLLDVPAHIVVPRDIIPAKRAATQAYGAQLIETGPSSAERRTRAEELAQQEGWALVPPYDDPAIIAGQGTVALELLQDVPDLDALVVPIGGGGLAAGCALAARAQGRPLRIVGVEPADGDDTRQSLQAGHRMRIPPPQTIADGLRAVEPGELTFDILQQHLDDVVTVSDDDIRRALRLLLERTKLVAEPSGAVAFAAVLTGAAGVHGKVGVLVSGGNVSLDTLSHLLEPPAQPPENLRRDPGAPGG